MIDELKRIKARPLHTEGYNNAEWILIDYGAFVVHVFTEESRSFTIWRGSGATQKRSNFKRWERRLPRAAGSRQADRSKQAGARIRAALPGMPATKD